jgi:hypothetical protein
MAEILMVIVSGVTLRINRQRRLIDQITIISTPRDYRIQTQYTWWQTAITLVLQSSFPWLRRSVAGLTAAHLVQPKARTHGICGRQTDTGIPLSTTILGFPLSASFRHVHTHSLIYHRRCILFFSQYFSFTVSVSFCHAPYSFIHSSTTNVV